MWPAVSILAALLVLPPLLLSPSPATLLAFLSAAALLALLLLFAPQAIQRLVYAPPLLITLFLLTLFARSLLPGRQPLVSRIARLMHDNPSPALLRYTRGVTVAWVVFLALMLLEVIALGLFAGPQRWSLFTNFYNYLLLGLFFVLEFSLRRLFVAEAERMPMAQFFHRLVKLDYRQLFRQG
jgi:uncharacterized membrane protein